MAVRSRTSSQASASTSQSVTLPSGITPGDRLIVGFVSDGSSAATTSSTGWSSLGTVAQGANHTVTVFTKVATGSDALTVAIAASQAAAWVSVAMIGNGGTPTLQLNSGAAATTGPVTAITGLASGSYDDLIFLGLDNSAGTSHTVTPPSGFGNLTTVGTSADPLIAASMDTAFVGTSSSPADVTWTNSEQWITAHVAVAFSAVPPRSRISGRRPLAALARRRRFFAAPAAARPGFVGRTGATLTLDGAAWNPVGFNAFGAFGGDGAAWTRTQMDSFFASLPAKSVTRTWCFDGYATTSLMDDWVASAAAAGQKLILTLNNDGNDLVLDGAKTNTWYASGYASATYVGGAGSWHTWISTICARYKDSPAVAMWEVINEAGISQGVDHVLSGSTMQSFYATVAGWIKAADPNHLVGTGDVYEAVYQETSSDGGKAQYQTASSATGIDVLSLHDYELDYGGTSRISSHYANCSAAAAALSKPLIVGEVNHTACSLDKRIRAATVQDRIDAYFAAGANAVLVWNYSQIYYETCSTNNSDYTLVAGDPLTIAIRAYALPTAVVSETWTGTTGASWPAQWTVTPNAGAATIQSNAGRLTSPASAYGRGAMAYLGAMAARATTNLRITATWATTAEQYTYIWVCADGTTGGTAPANGYGLVLAPNGAVFVTRTVASTSTDLLSTGFVFAANTAYLIRFLVIPSTGFWGVRIWTGTAADEPGTWTFAGVDSSPYAGGGRVRLLHTSGAAATAQQVDLDDLSITIDSSVEAFTVADTATGSDTVTFFDAAVLAPIGDTATGTDRVSVVDVASSTLLAPLHPAPVYELLVMARIPSAAAAPTLVIVDPIPWTTLDWSTTLSAPQTLDVTCSLATLTEPVLQRFRRPARLATELWLLRNGQTVFAGPLAGGRRDGEQLQLHADGLLAYAARWRVFSDLPFAAVDQALIVKALFDHWQGRPYGNFGIDTSAIAAVGVTRDATYLATELHPILQRTQELGQRQNGFDVDVDPSSRQLQIWYPQRGVDRSSGEDAIVFDSRNITTASTMFSVGPDDVASVGFGTGTSSDVATGTLYSTKTNAELLAQYGAVAASGTWDSVKEQATLDGHVQALLDARSDALIVPGPNVRVTPDADLSAYDVGDTVAFDVDDQLGVTGAFRLRARRVSVSESGQELITPTFV